MEAGGFQIIQTLSQMNFVWGFDSFEFDQNFTCTNKPATN